MDISIYSPFSPLLKVSITHFYDILTRLYLELLFTFKDQIPSSPSHQTYFHISFNKGNVGKMFRTCWERIGKTNFLIWQVMSKRFALQCLNQCLPLY